MLFTPGRSKDLGMSYEDSRTHCQQLNGIHPWVGSAMEVTTLQRMVKEGQYNVARAKQYTHERTKDLGMSYEDSRTHCQQLNGIHPWVGSAMEVTALQRMVKEGQYNVARAKQYTHERTKERLTKMRALPTPSPTESPQPQHTLPEPARGHRMTR